jgi:hypothetical protein
LGYWGFRPKRYRSSGPGRRAHCGVPERHEQRTLGDVSKQSTKRKLIKVSSRLTSLRSELVAVDEQTLYLRQEADDSETRALVAENTGVDREARQAREHADANAKQRERVIVEIAQLEQRQDELLDQLTSSD